MNLVDTVRLDFGQAKPDLASGARYPFGPFPPVRSSVISGVRRRQGNLVAPLGAETVSRHSLVEGLYTG